MAAILLSNLLCTEVGGSLSAEVISCWCGSEQMGEVSRSIGLNGDPLRVVIDAASLPEDWDLEGGTYTLQFGDDVDYVLLGGYRAANIQRTSVMKVTDGGAYEARQIVIDLVTRVGLRARSNGPRIRTEIAPPAIINPLGDDGRPDSGDANYQTIQEIVELLLDAICASGVGGLTHMTAPADLNTAIDNVTALDPPGPLDLGNADAMALLEGILRPIGWTAVLNLDGDSIDLVRLKRGGETITVPGPMAAVAEPYELGYQSGVRPSTIIVTSGATRSIIIGQYTLFELEWVAQDPRTGAWMNNTEWSAAYAGEIAPGDIDEWKAGPDDDKERERTRARLFSALRLANATDRRAASGFVAIPHEVDITGGPGPFAGEIGFIAARYCEKRGNQFANVPEGAHDAEEPGDLVRIEGARFISGAGVIVLPGGGNHHFVRMDGGGLGIGTYADAVELAPGDGPEADPLELGDLTVVFAHEAREGDYATDFYSSVWQVANTAGVLSVTRVTDAGLIDDAFESFDSAKIDVPALQRYLEWPYGDDPDYPEELNDTELHAIAKQIALMRAGDDLVQAGVIVLNGYQQVAPGDWGGAVTRVTWSHRTRTTRIEVNSHEIASSGGAQAMIARRAAASIGAGLSRLSLSGSWSGVGGGVGSGAANPQGGAASDAGGMPTVGSAAQLRGREAYTPTARNTAPGSGTAHERGDGPDAIDRIWVKLTGSTEIADGVWDYDWEEIRLTGTGFEDVTDPRTSTSMGIKARNTLEIGNNSGTYYGNDAEKSTIPSGWEIKPIGLNGEVERPIEIWGPVGVGEDRRWLFTLHNQIDGECAA